MADWKPIKFDWDINKQQKSEPIPDIPIAQPDPSKVPADVPNVTVQENSQITEVRSEPAAKSPLQDVAIIPIPRTAKFAEPNMRGNDIQLIQSRLRIFGFPVGTMDGVFGRETQNKVIEFQKKYMLTPDGIVGPKTARALSLQIAGNVGAVGPQTPAHIPDVMPKQETSTHKPKPTLQQMRDELVRYWTEDLGQLESQGPNRSPMIDAINRRIGVPLGSSYCVAALLVRGVSRLCESYNLRNPVHMTAGTQDFWNSAPPQYRKEKGELAKKADIGILRNKTDHSHGHAFGHRRDETSKGQYTIEYNTNTAGSSNGDGVYEATRYQTGTNSKEFRGSVDVVQWIADSNAITA